jgi:enamine deaminase RidA (YjgF/YER057c/UK114 family)
MIRDAVAEPDLPLGNRKNDFMGTVHDRLKTLQITLPDTPPSVVDGYIAAFVPFVRTGNLIHFSGRLAKKDGQLWVGKLGEEITAAEGKQAARSVAIELLAALQEAIGDLNDVRRIVKLVVFVNSAPHFTEPHVVANGASELLLEVFGDRGAHARSALGVSQVPFGCCVEIEMVVDICPSNSACQM